VSLAQLADTTHVPVPLVMVTVLPEIVQTPLTVITPVVEALVVEPTAKLEA
jgi:hypothetical protein